MKYLVSDLSFYQLYLEIEAMITHRPSLRILAIDGDKDSSEFEIAMAHADFVYVRKNGRYHIIKHRYGVTEKFDKSNAFTECYRDVLVVKYLVDEATEIPHRIYFDVSKREDRTDIFDLCYFLRIYTYPYVMKTRRPIMDEMRDLVRQGVVTEDVSLSGTTDNIKFFTLTDEFTDWLAKTRLTRQLRGEKYESENQEKQCAAT